MYQKVFRSFLALLLFIGLMAIHATQSARAAGPWYVTTTGNDSNDCLSPGSPCATINGAIGKAVDGDIIHIAMDTYTGTGPDYMVVLIDKSLTLSGGWDSTFSDQNGYTTIDVTGKLHGVVIKSGVNATIERFRVQNASSADGNAIFNQGTLNLNSSSISDNTSSYRGGGIYNSGNLNILNSSLSNNSAEYGGGGIYNSDGSILVLTQSTVSNNSANGGGGIWNSGGVLSINKSTISGNTSPYGFGGALISSGGNLGSSATTIINNSTITGNKSLGYHGGGIVNYPNSTVILTSSTVSNNYSFGNGGGIYVLGGVIVIENTLLANNSASGAGQNCIGTLNSHGYNLIGSIDNCYVIGNTTGNLIGVNPLFAPLQDNGGPTLTHALLVGSPAIDTGNPQGCTDQDGNLLSTDQRGIARPQGTTCDIGAYEFVATINISIDIKPDSDTNPINMKSRGTTPVAILSTADFDAATMVDQTSLTFGATGDEVSLAFCNNDTQDVNSDGLPDLVCHFYTQQTGFQLGDSEGVLKGQTVDGIALEGSDVITYITSGNVDFNVCPFDPITITLSSPDPAWVPVQITTSGQDLNFGADDPPGVNWAVTDINGTVLLEGGRDDHLHFTWYNFSDPGSYYVVFSHPEAGSTYPTIQINLACGVDAPEP